ncbi:hypothetical protein A4X09_0g7603 [Tilletia walkeri]|uniref:Uncharacterized protein n=1 Tax=Tilletia walkeri TaxID=117179 RepID=A0A8X7T0V0_9BASI|nr:hypothetical protein A4X09_0g7603 [Tilletia walkeri]
MSAKNQDGLEPENGYEFRLRAINDPESGRKDNQRFRFCGRQRLSTVGAKLSFLLRLVKAIQDGRLQPFPERTWGPSAPPTRHRGTRSSSCNRTSWTRVRSAVACSPTLLSGRQVTPVETRRFSNSPTVQVSMSRAGSLPFEGWGYIFGQINARKSCRNLLSVLCKRLEQLVTRVTCGLYGKHFLAGGRGSTAAEMASYWGTLHIAGTQYKPVCGALGYNSITALAQAGDKGDIGVKFVFRKYDFALSRIQGDGEILWASLGTDPANCLSAVMRLCLSGGWPRLASTRVLTKDTS